MSSNKLQELPIHITLFQNSASVEDLFFYNRTKIIQFLKKIRSDPDQYTHTIYQPQLRKACELIIDFDYNQKHRCFVNERGVLTPKLWTWCDNQEVPFYTIYDVLGYIVSVTNPAPHKATAFEFYLPLLAVYTRWCIGLSAKNQNNKTVNVPTRSFIAWLPSSDGQISLGTENLPQTVGATIPKERNYHRLRYRDKIQIERARWMRDGCKIPIRDYFKLPDANINLSPARPSENVQGQLFGHCAETIPLALRIQKHSRQERSLLKGISLETAMIEKMPVYDVPRAVECIDDPCPNCRAIMDRTGVDYRRFLRSYNTRKVLEQGYRFPTSDDPQSKHIPSRSNTDPSQNSKEDSRRSSHRRYSDPHDRQALKALHQRSHDHGVHPTPKQHRKPEQQFKSETHPPPKSQKHTKTVDKRTKPKTSKSRVQ